MEQLPAHACKYANADSTNVKLNLVQILTFDQSNMYGIVVHELESSDTVELSRYYQLSIYVGRINDYRFGYNSDAQCKIDDYFNKMNMLAML